MITGRYPAMIIAGSVMMGKNHDGMEGNIPLPSMVDR
jgi:hypothetical protein